jgi:membrane fusion protein (multidrug efflux system)
MPKQKRILVITALILLIGGISWHYYAKAKSGAAGGWGAMPPTPVNATKAVIQGWQQHIQATGTLNAEQGVMLKAETAGRITKIYVESGQEVKAGDPLFEINPAVMQANLASDEAQAELDSGNYDRAIQLYKRGALSKQDLATALANKNVSIAKMESTKAELTQNIIHAPFSGKLGIRLFNLGDYINEAQALINLQALNSLRVDFTVPEKVAGQVHIGDLCQIKSAANPNLAVTGKVTAIDSAIDMTTRTLAVRALVANPQQTLLPGNFVEVSLSVGTARPLVTLPLTAVVYDTTANYVYKIINNHAVKNNVEIADQNDHQVAIQSGVKPGDMVITDGQLKVMDGAPVMLLPPQKAE